MYDAKSGATAVVAGDEECFEPVGTPHRRVAPEGPGDPSLASLRECIRRIDLARLAARLIAQRPDANLELVRELERANLTDLDRHELLAMMERFAIADPESRRRVREALLGHARSLSRSPSGKDEPLLWAALRGYASLASTADMEQLVPFIRAEISDRTKLLVCELVQQVLGADGIPEHPDRLSALREGIRSLLSSLDPAMVRDLPRLGALATNALAALAAMDDRRFAEFAIELERIQFPPVTRRLRELLQGIQGTWARMHPKSEATRRAQEYLHVWLDTHLRPSESTPNRPQS